MALMECVFHALATPPPTVLLNRLAKVSNTTPKAGYTPGSWREHMKREYARAIVEGPSPNVAAKEASSHMKNNQRTILLLPDLIIYWGIVRQYQNVFNSACIQDDIGSGDCDSDGDGDDDSDTCVPKGLMVMKEDGRTRFTEEGSGALLDIAKIMFRIYEAFQKKGHVSRDTVQRFLTDICGEGTPEQPNVKQVLERMYTIKDKGEDALAARHLTQLSENQFIQSLRRTVHIAYASDDSPKGLEHILIDWFIRLASTMMPGYLSDMKRFFSSSPQSVGIGTLLKAKLEMLRSSTADTEVMKLYRKFDISEDGAGFRSNSSSMKKSSSMHMHLYEVKRRFQSIISKGIEQREIFTIEESEEESSYSGGSSAMEEEGHHLPIEECDETSPSKISRIGDLPRNVIDEDTFVHTLSDPDHDMGHGGFVTKQLAGLLFRAGCFRAEERSRLQSLQINMETLSHMGIDFYGQRAKDSNKMELNETCFWDVHDAVLFGCAAVRGELVADNDEEPIFEILFLMFSLMPLKMPSVDNCVPSAIETLDSLEESGDRVMTRGQVGSMIILLMEQFTFRVQADSPRVNSPEDDCNTKVVHGQNCRVDASAASLLGLMPESIADDDHENRQTVSLDLLVNQVFHEVGKDGKDDSICLTFEDFRQWARASFDPNKSMDFSDRKINPLVLDLRLIGSIVFGIKPSSPTLERIVIDEVQQRFKYRHPSSNIAQRGPSGTHWYIIQKIWWNEWMRYSEEALALALPKIANEQLLVENGSLILKPGFRLRTDVEVCALNMYSYLAPPVQCLFLTSSHNRIHTVDSASCVESSSSVA